VGQLSGAVCAAVVLYIIASGKPRFDLSAGFASNGYGEHSPGGYSTVACFVAEVVLTAFFLLIIMGATDSSAPQGFAPIAIGLGLTLIHLVGIRSRIFRLIRHAARHLLFLSVGGRCASSGCFGWRRSWAER